MHLSHSITSSSMHTHKMNHKARQCLRWMLAKYECHANATCLRLPVARLEDGKTIIQATQVELIGLGSLSTVVVEGESSMSMVAGG